MDCIEEPASFASLFHMATRHLSLSSTSTAHSFATQLGTILYAQHQWVMVMFLQPACAGFTSIIFETKAKFLSTEGYELL